MQADRPPLSVWGATKVRGGAAQPVTRSRSRPRWPARRVPDVRTPPNAARQFTQIFTGHRAHCRNKETTCATGGAAVGAWEFNSKTEVATDVRRRAPP